MHHQPLLIRVHSLLFGLVLLVFALVMSFRVVAQDFQYSQFYAAPLAHNPAFIGSAFRPRVFFSHRNQWTGSSSPFIGNIVSADYYLKKYTCGIGATMANEKAADGANRNFSFAGQYAYHAKLSRKWSMNFGMQLGIVSRNVGFANLLFYDQIDTAGNIALPTKDGLSESSFSFSFADLGSGLLFYSPTSWIGLSVHHVNAPKQDLLGDLNRLDRKFTLQAGKKILLGLSRDTKFPDQLPSVTLAALIKSQGQFRQLDLGTYLHLQPLVLGLWYRGLPFLGGSQGLFNQDALIALIGLKQDNLTMGYSYDLNLSGLVSAYGGSHEITVSYAFDYKEPKRRKGRALPCPSF